MYSNKDIGCIQACITGNGGNMKSYKLFTGVVLVGFGLYFLLNEINMSPFPDFYSWPTLLIIVGLAFLCQGFIGKDHGSILPGVILTGFGLHFHLVNKLAIWPDDTGTFLLIIALGFILFNQRAGSGLVNGVLFLLLAGLLLFYEEIVASITFIHIGESTLKFFTPLLFLLIGGYFLLSKRK
ncbi:LiaI-LiaF-like domain-containing protein [Niallia sp. FSL R7-0271]|uniref:LiaI-LiaF-like domain-containing protein n=1 Tax=Niallia sp. FSL R7-0271 TaxID=2921678 RepID=UPI0040487D0C